jgi:hypothetical protein
MLITGSNFVVTAGFITEVPLSSSVVFLLSVTEAQGGILKQEATWGSQTDSGHWRSWRRSQYYY